MNYKAILFYGGAGIAGIIAGDQVANIVRGGSFGGNGPLWGNLFSNATLVDYYFPEFWAFAVGVLLMVLGALLP